jgi:hypothetical protein
MTATPVVIVDLPQTLAGYHLRARVQARWPWATVVLVPRLTNEATTTNSTPEFARRALPKSNGESGA